MKMFIILVSFALTTPLYTQEEEENDQDAVIQDQIEEVLEGTWEGHPAIVSIESEEEEPIEVDAIVWTRPLDDEDIIDSAEDLMDEIVLGEGESFILLSFSSIVGNVNSAFPVSLSGDEKASIWRGLKVGRAMGNYRIEGGVGATEFYHRPEESDEEPVSGVYRGMGLSGGVFRDFELSDNSNKSFYVGGMTTVTKRSEDWRAMARVSGGMRIALNESVYASFGNTLSTTVEGLYLTWVGRSEIGTLIGRPNLGWGPTQFRMGFQTTWTKEISNGGISYPRFIFKFNLKRQGTF